MLSRGRDLRRELCIRSSVLSSACDAATIRRVHLSNLFNNYIDARNALACHVRSVASVTETARSHE